MSWKNDGLPLVKAHQEAVFERRTRQLCKLNSLRPFILDVLPPQWYALPISISLPPDLDDRIQQKVMQAGYRTPDEVIRKALDALDAQEQQAVPQRSRGTKNSAVPVWQRFQTAARSIPEEELAALPPDGASEHDHYLYGLPKRSA